MKGNSSGGSTEYVPLTMQTAGLESNHDNTQHEQNEQPNRKERTVWNRIGTIGILTIFPGSILLLLPLALLSLIWKQSTIAVSGGEPPKPWIQIIEANWMTRLVTVCTALIRIIIALQASQATAMLASVILEATGTPLLHMPFFSIVRAVGTAPNNLLYPVRLQPTKGALSFFIWVLIIVEVVATVASQFLSTLLISDIGDGTFTNLGKSTNVPIIRNERLTVPWWSSFPASSWRFAETSEPFSEGPGYHNTGHTYRAFLPFETEAEQTSLRRYHGVAPVTDHQVVCMCPSLANLTLTGLNGVRLSGQASIGNKSYPTLLDGDAPHYYTFDCAIPSGALGDDDNGGESSLCASNFLATSTEEPLLDNFPSWIFFVFDVISMGAVSSVFHGSPTQEFQTVRDDGPWVVVNNGSTELEALRMTVCVTNTVANTFLVDMHSDSEGFEPRMSWNRDRQSYNTSETRRQLGLSLTPESLNRRGVLSLSPRSQWQEYTDELPDRGANSSFTVWPFLSSLPVPGADSLPENSTLPNKGVLLSKTDTTTIDNAHLSHVHVFQDTLRDTGSPALAIQGLVARSSLMVYHEQFSRLDTATSATVAFALTELTPIRWAGFIVSAVILATHMAIVGIVTGLFVKYTRSSFLGEFWQAISQVASKDVLPVIEQVEDLKDEEVERWGKYQEPRLAQQTFLRYRRDERGS
ncbi:hypothetical protein BDV06DRAFT_199482 [Aspergillus oleicola]